MLVTFEVMEKKGELVAIHDGSLGVLVAFGDDYDMLRDMINETIASVIGEEIIEIEIELFIDVNHRTRFKHVYDETVAERIRQRSHQ